MPYWLHVLSVISLILAGISAVIIVVDIFAGHRQQMWIMEIVWPATALYSGPLGLWAYYKMGRIRTRRNVRRAKAEGKKHPGKDRPLWQAISLGSMHCGSGCSLGDLCAEWLTFFLPFYLFDRLIFAAWVIDYLFAFLFGIAFQYFTIKPMRGLTFEEGVLAALKADTISLTSWQIGMYGWMAIATFLIFGHELEKTDPTFWFMMQIAMLAGFVTSYPVNWWLLKKGIKEKM